MMGQYARGAATSSANALRLADRMPRNLSIAASLAVALVLVGCDNTGSESMTREIDYNWDIRPILSENCFQCHGPDPESLKAGLRLDDGRLAVQRLEGPRPRFAIVPGDPDVSELIYRINVDDPDEVMPPPSTHKSLSQAQKDALRAWIARGAEYRDHWAFIPAARPQVPEPTSSRPGANAIDRFIEQRLVRAELSPSPEANRATLINRVTLTLTGLPPSIEDVDEFVADADPDAYEHLVDRLLASPRYAEHMAAYWMDLARWSESDGFLDDHHDRWLWPWRDWVIDAFQSNMPFDEFGTLQLAGDLLPDAGPEQILPTAYLRVGKRTTENGAIEDEYKAEYMIERTDNALGTAFLGLTVGCARCHDHKYDPIAQRDYYALGAFFNSNDEPGVYAPGFSGIQGGPTLPWPDDAMRDEVDRLAMALEGFERDYAQQVAAAAPRFEAAARELSPAQINASLRASLERTLVAYYPFDTATPATLQDLPPPRRSNSPPHSIVRIERNPYGAPSAETTTAEQRRRRTQEELLAGVPRNYVQAELALSPSGVEGVPAAVVQGPLLRGGVRGQALFFDETNKGFLGMDVGWYDNEDNFTFDFWFYTAEHYDKVPVLNHRTEQNSGYTGYSLDIEDGRLWLRFAHSPPANMIALRSVEPLPVGEWSHITFTYDGSSRAAGARLYLNGEPLDAEVVRDTLTRTFLPWSSGDVFEQFVGLSFGTRFRAKAPVGSGLDELRVFERALTPAEVAYLHRGPFTDVEDAVGVGLANVLLSEDTDIAASFERLTAARGAHNRAVSVVPQVLVMRDAPEPIPTFVLNRGLYSTPGERVEPHGLDFVLAWDTALPRSRLGLAQWLFDPGNPLTARVFVNRVWQMHFGRGIVETAEDFGSQGAIPTHPELLDWLATEFVESGWDIKALHRLIVMSATYRQTSDASDELLTKDVRNELLARGPRWRMTAEMVRDSALAVSGLLTDQIGGESVKPYQPDGIWNPTNTFYLYPQADAVPPEEHHRRTLYTFVKRNALHPTLGVFDFSNRTESKARRRSSNTPLQALTLMNDPQYVEAYRILASDILRAGGTRQEQLTRIYRKATRATPSTRHLQVLAEYFDYEAARYAANDANRSALLGVGVTPADESIDATELAAMTHVAALVMNSPDAYMVR